MSPRVLVGVGLLALAVGAWLAMRPRAADPDVAATPASASAAGEPAPVVADSAPAAGLAAAVEPTPFALPTSPAAEESPSDVWQVRGVVVDPDGRPVSQAEISVHAELRLREDVANLELEERLGTDSEGHFRTRRARPGPKWLLVMPGSPWTPRVVRVEASEREVRVALERGRNVSVSVVDSTGAPVRGARVSSRPPPDPAAARRSMTFQAPGTDWTEYLLTSTRALARTTDPHGVARLPVSRLPVVLSVEPPLDLDALPARDVAAEAEAVTVRLDPSFEISGTVVDAAGTPVGRGVVVWRMKDRAWTKHAISDDGLFDLGRLPRGIVELRAQLHGLPPDGPCLETPTGRRDLVLTIDPGTSLRLEAESAAVLHSSVLWVEGRPVNDRDLGAGHCTYPGLRRDAEYSLYVAAGDRGLLWQGRVERNVTLPLRPVPLGTLDVILDGTTSDAVVRRATIAGTPWGVGRAIASDVVRFEGVPEGQHGVSVELRATSGRLSGSARANVPGRVRIRLEPAANER